MAKVFLRAYNREIETMIDRGQLDEAIAHCHHILKTFPKHLETYRLLGKAYLESKRYSDAVDVFSRVLASVPNDFVSQVGLSIIRDEENKLDDAIWHMERAFETQPSNAAIQSELQRLYGRRDGVQPPRIRMTRGALAHMYVQGELYPQAISEIKSVLKEDPGRSDMQALLARANFKSGAKNDAVDAALTLLQRYPYALDANRVLVEVLSADRNENAHSYRQRVVELDPYAAQVAGSVFQSNEVADAAVSLERLDWNGQPVGMQSDWRESQAIGLEGGRPSNEQPDWMKNPFGEASSPPPSQPTSDFAFDTPASPQTTPAQPADELPDFLKAAGWGESTGAFDETKSMFADEEPAAPVQPLAQGDLPDWVKAMKPAEPEPAAPQQEEELPDWINKIGTGALGASDAQPNWMNQPEEAQEPAATPSTDQPDWLTGFDTPQESAQSAQDQPDWLKGIGSESDFAPQPAQTDTPDWLKGLGDEPDLAAPPAQTDSPDWLKALDSEPVTPTAESDDDWLKQFGTQPADTTEAPADFDFLTELTQEPVLQTPEEVTQPTNNFDELGKSEQEREDSFAWLENLAAKQGASEGLLTQPEERLQDEPDWVKQAKGPTIEPAVSQPPANLEELGKSEQERDDSFAWLENLAAKQGASEGLLTKPEERMEEEPEWVKQARSLTSEQPPIVQSSANVEELGKSEQERDDSFAWLENLAAKQGASEGLLTKPEDRLEDEPEWVKQAKELNALPPAAPVVEPPLSEPQATAEEPGKSETELDEFAWLDDVVEDQGTSEGLLIKPEERLQEEPEWVDQSISEPAATSVSQPPANVEELGKSDQERDDSFAWLENLAAKQGASEGLLTKPEERLQEEPEWVKQAKSMPAETPVSQQPANVEELGKSEQERDDSFAWLENLAAKQGASEGLLTKPEERMEQEPEWVRQAKDVSAQPSVIPIQQEESFLEQPATEQPAPLDETAAWLKSLEEEEKQSEPVPATDETALWLKNLEQAESVTAEPAAESVDADMPAWMKNIDQDEAPAAEPAIPAHEAELPSVEPEPDESAVPSWLSDLDKEETVIAPSNADDLPAWLRDDMGEVVAEPVKIEPTRPTDWQPFEPRQPEIQYSPPIEEPTEPEIIYSPPLEETRMPEPEEPVPSVSLEAPEEKPASPPQEQPKPEPRAPKTDQVKAATRPEPYREPVTRSRGTGMLVTPGIDPMLGSARSELSRSNIPGALESYGRLIKKGRFLDEVIYDLREALYRYPVEVSIWQSLGDAYMRANRLQDALDAYTKAEELLR